MIWIGAGIVVLTIIAILRNYENRLVLTISGLAMAAVAGIGAAVAGVNPVAFFDAMQKFLEAFSAQLVSETLVPVTCAALGYSFLMEKTGCTEGLVSVLSKPLRKFSALMIPGTVIIVFFLNIAIISASGIGAAAAPLLIPIMLAAGIHPAIAAAAVLMGTWGSSLNPGFTFVAQTAELSGTAPAEIVAANILPEVVALLVASLALTVVAFITKEHKGYESKIEVKEFAKINPIKSIMPLVPLALLVLATTVPGFPKINVLGAMLLGAGITLLLVFFLDRSKPGDMTKEFFRGMGESFSSIIGLMAAAGAFTAGLAAVGITSSLIGVMEGSDTVARAAGAVGPFLLAVLTGSGNAATAAFNQAITPFAADFGMTIDGLGSIAQICAQLGRCASPVAGITIIVASVSGAEPMKIIKRTFVPSVLAMLVIMVML